MNAFSADSGAARCYFCERHIEGEIVRRTVSGQREHTLHPECVTKLDIELEKEAAALEEQRVKKIRCYALERSDNESGAGLAQIPVIEWKWADLASPLFKQRVRPRFFAFAKTFKFDRSAVLLGDTGTGKTATTRAALFAFRAACEKEAIATPGMSAEQHRGLAALRSMRWYSGSQVALARKQFALGKGDAELIEDAISARILVVDECGFEAADGALFDIVDTRYMRERPTLVTTGLTVDRFKSRYGDAMWRRLTERGLKVESFGD